jgi:hypothetical protein
MERGPKLGASEILEWDYLCQIAEFVEAPRNWDDGVKRFACKEARNTMLSDLLLNATYKQSTNTTGYIIDTLAKSLRINKLTLRQFARGRLF